MAHSGWNGSLETGDARVDEQHRVLFEKIAELQTAIVTKSSHAHVMGLLDQVISLAGEHFTDEEALMASHAYPGLSEQRDLHRLFRDDVDRMTAEFRVSGGTLPLRISVFLHEWLTRHMKIEDRKIVEFIRSAEDSPADRPTRS